MANYEILYIISPSVSEEEREALINKFKAYVENNKGTIAGIDKWGLRRLAYPIKFKNEGFYVLMTYSCEPQVSYDMEMLMNITDGVLRSIVVRK